MLSLLPNSLYLIPSSCPSRPIIPRSVLLLSTVQDKFTRPTRLVEYAMEAISHAGTVLAILTKEGIVIAAEKKVTGKLLDLSGAKEGGYGGSGEKIFLLNSFVLTLSTPFWILM